MTSPVPVFDGHNDVLLRLHLRGGVDAPDAFLQGEGKGHVDLPMARQGGLAGGLFAIFVPSRGTGPGPGIALQDATPPSVDAGYAETTTIAMTSLMLRIERQSVGQVAICRAADEIEHCMANNVMAAVLHLEGAEAVDPDFALLDVLHRAGLRSLGPVWSRANIFGFGVPFRMNASPDIGPGLTERGKDLVRRCNAMRILVDLSHLNEKGFWDVAGLSDAPLVASHSNAHELCPHARNLTAKQCAAIRDSGGFVGVNFAPSFLRADGARDPDTPVEIVIDHVEYLLRHIGEDHVGFGSDFDGTTMLKGIRNAAGLQSLVAVMRARGYGETLIAKICWQNWLRVLRRTWQS
ncbi:MAG: dipeptidase [Pseudorhodoplanes sp.]